MRSAHASTGVALRYLKPALFALPFARFKSKANASFRDEIRIHERHDVERKRGRGKPVAVLAAYCIPHGMRRVLTIRAARLLFREPGRQDFALYVAFSELRP